MKYLSLTLMILTLLTGIATVSYTATEPFTSDISLSCSPYETIYIDDKLEVEAAAYPYDSVDNHITWSIDDENIATLTDTVNHYKYIAVITPLAIGRTTITATTRNNISKSFDLEVVAREVNNVSISTDCEYSTILTGSEYTMTATIQPSNATYKTITWTSSNESVITVDQNGNFKAVGEGRATITATAHNGKSASKTFTVKDEILVESITITNTDNLSLNGSRNLTYKVTPGNASVVDVTWTSSNEDIISITQEGKITALAVGSSTITVTNVNGKTYSATITVPRVVARTIRINNPDSLIMNVGSSLQLTYYIYPKDVTDPITWSSSDPELISVDQNGKVTAHAQATTGVIITLTCGDEKATIILFATSTT